MNYTEETFPYNNWYMKFTEEERPIVDNWRINIIKFSPYPCSGNYVNYHGEWEGLVRPLWLVSFFDFKKFVLKEEIINQDYDYLIDVFKKYNIL